jgi:hypothetical protein
VRPYTWGGAIQFLTLLPVCFLTSFKSKGEHDHPKPETKLEAEARRAMKKVHMASASSSLKLKGTPDTKVTHPHGCSGSSATVTPVVGVVDVPGPLLTNKSQQSYTVRLIYKQAPTKESESEVFIVNV